jgi:flagellar hook-length control protein FliK
LEILSNIGRGTGSGAEFGLNNQASRTGPPNNSNPNANFARTINNAREAVQRNSPSDRNVNDRFNDPRNKLRIRPEIPDEPDETLVAGVTNNQMVVSILEGDKESATTPLTQTFAAQTQEAVKPEQLTENMQVNPNGENMEDKSAAIQKDIFADVLQQSELAAKAGEVTARTPETGISEQRLNTEINSKSSEHGDLSPLENENDVAPVKEQKQSLNDMTQDKSRDKEAEQPLNNIQAHMSDEGIRPERLKAEEQLKSVALNPPVHVDNLFEEMIERVNLMKTETQNTMTIKLRPEFLGEVALELVSTAAGLAVKIEAANGDVRAMINSQVTALIESLEQKGIEVVEVEVTHTGVNIGAHNTGPHGEHGNSNGSRNNGYRRDQKPERIDLFAGLRIDVAEYYLDAGVSSMEFSA